MSAAAARTTAAAPAWPGLRTILAPDDVHRVLATVNAAGVTRAATAELRRPVDRAADLDERGPAGQLPAHPLLQPVLPWPGLRRGTTIATTGATGATSLVLALLATAMTEGGYAAVIGWPDLGVVAAAEHGIPLDRLALVPYPGHQWPEVAGILLDGVDLVVVHPAAEVAAGVARSLSARARRRSAVLVSTAAWPGCDLTLSSTHQQWGGLGHGRGRLRWQELTVEVVGRGGAARRRQVTVPMPLPAPASLVDEQSEATATQTSRSKASA